MGYMACVPLRFGERTIQPGEEVPVEKGRNYAMLLRHGHIVVTDERAKREPASGRSSGRAKREPASD